eukprot:TRINITY_DN4357_c0_g3_i2.p1 TRINITY_DN4357_c0_g3~~TRINITY_DN4357_c0_g3_i2.p1  ORF type:complete len:432 (+),score=113.85 TRINITY_DN4357_c0_g3_i2:516-1811(+)
MQGTCPINCSPLESRVFVAQLPRSGPFDSDLRATYTPGTDSVSATCSDRIVAALELLHWRDGGVAVRCAAGASTTARAVVAETASSVASRVGKSFTPARTLVIVCDRGADVLTPLLYGGSYQALVHDLLQVKHGVVEGSAQHQSVSLNEANQLWRAVRHLPLLTARVTVARELESFNSQTRDQQQQYERIASLSQSVKALSFTEAYRKRLSALVSVADAATAAFNARRLSAVVQQQQSLSEAAAKGASYASVLPDLTSLLSDEASGIKPADSVHLAAAFAASFPNAPERLRTSLCELSGDPQCSAKVKKLARLGLNLSTHGGGREARGYVDPERFGGGGRLQTLPQRVWRHEPRLCKLLDEATSGAFESELWMPGSSFGELRGPPQRTLLFVVGGVCHSEIVSVYSRGEVVLGGTSVVTPDSFMHAVGTLP